MGAVAKHACVCMCMHAYVCVHMCGGTPNHPHPYPQAAQIT